ncbi:LamG-like jellyroll fold domain-containing protein [Aeoliella mucimassa]|uniref:FecR protein n=1 Tax=Aeoliella mucimassa TaxID=2527972 RepID=A0A518ANB6_9BACT|nr:LamG-like jellyroll fold domain-containing protein [Aeoliella mucimassa]QDU56222.1 FecR protein [Aeoliella mucimassa]
MQSKHQLLEKYLNGELSADERAQLEEKLLADEGELQEFAELLLVSSDLKDRDFTFTRREAEPPVVAPVTLPKRDSRSRAPWMGWLLAASIAVVSTIGVLRWLQPDFSNVAGIPGGMVGSKEPAHAAVVPTLVSAYVGRTDQCEWQADPLVNGDLLHQGDVVALNQGVAELIFDDGARVIAQGPCTLEISDSNSFSLSLGNVSVEATYGFKVGTPSGIVLDLGTEFGVAVDHAGGSEVHVFKGEVAFQAVNAGGTFQGKPLKLKADQACSVAIGGVTLQEFEANEAKFDWRNRPQLLDSDAPDMQVRKNLTLWLAADRMVEVDEQNRVSQWRDLMVRGNNTPEDALQTSAEHQPLLVADAIHGHPAVRFGEGGTFLVTPPLHTTDEQTAFVVCSLNEIKPAFQQILNYNGPPQRVVPPFGGLVSPSVFEICLRDRDDDGRFAVCGEVFSGFSDGRTEIYKGAVEVLDRMPIAAPQVICFRYSLAAEKMTLYLNGRKRSESAAREPIAITSRKILGRHPILSTGQGIFRGDIGELLLFNRALTDEEVTTISAYLCKRFDIAVDKR